MTDDHKNDKTFGEAVWIGAGNMGLPMAKNLLASGIRLGVHNRSKNRLTPLLEAGALEITDLPGSLSATPLVFTMLADDAAVGEMVSKSGGKKRTGHREFRPPDRPSGGESGRTPRVSGRKR